MLLKSDGTRVSIVWEKTFIRTTVTGHFYRFWNRVILYCLVDGDERTPPTFQPEALHVMPMKMSMNVAPRPACTAKCMLRKPDQHRRNYKLAVFQNTSLRHSSLWITSGEKRLNLSVSSQLATTGRYGRMKKKSTKNATKTRHLASRKNV